MVSCVGNGVRRVHSRFRSPYTNTCRLLFYPVIRFNSASQRGTTYQDPTFSRLSRVVQIFFFFFFSKQGEKNSRWKSRKKSCNFARPATSVFFTIVLSSSDYSPTETKKIERFKSLKKSYYGVINIWRIRNDVDKLI